MFRNNHHRQRQKTKSSSSSMRNEGIVVGIGVGITRDCTIIMTAQYFKKKREFVEALSVAASGLGICVMSTFLQKSIGALGWR